MFLNENHVFDVRKKSSPVLCIFGYYIFTSNYHYLRKGIVFFFSPEKFAGHSLTRFQKWDGKKKNKLFFFPAQNFQFLACFFFFLRKSLHCTHSLKIRGRKKKTAPEKKKTTFSLTHSNFVKKWRKTNFSGEKKNTVPLA